MLCCIGLFSVPVSVMVVVVLRLPRSLLLPLTVLRRLCVRDIQCSNSVLTNAIQLGHGLAFVKQHSDIEGQFQFTYCDKCVLERWYGPKKTGPVWLATMFTAPSLRQAKFSQAVLGCSTDLICLLAQLSFFFGPKVGWLLSMKVLQD